MAMLASSVLPMLMKPEVRKKVSKVAKYLLLFGGLGAGILMFVFISKKFNPFKSIGNWLKKSMGNPLGAIGSALGIPSFQQIGKDVQEGVSRFQKDVQKNMSGFGKDVAKGWTGFWSDVGKNVSSLGKSVSGGLKSQDQKRRQLRRAADPISRGLGDLTKLFGLPVAKRASAVKTAFKGVKKRPVRDVAKQFEKKFKRKRRARMGKELGSKIGTGMGAKMAAKWAAKWRR